jgi:diguanylate cyclase (GGDEF)-like protein
MPPHELCDLLRIDADEVRGRLDFFELGEADRRALERIRAAVEPSAEPIVEEVCARLTAEPNARRILEAPGAPARLQAGLKEYLLTFGRFDDPLEYVESRLRIGREHERLGLTPKWTLALHSVLSELIARRTETPGESESGTLRKILTFDMTLAVEIHFHASMRRLESILQTLAEAQQELKVAARIDELTQISNRRSLIESLEAEFQRSRRFGHPFTLVFVDLDRFKRVNDECGHGFGDFVLRRTVDLMRSVLRPADIIGRFGGEEFLIGLVMTDAANARKIAERIRDVIERGEYVLAGRSVKVTVSIGLATIDAESDKLETLIQLADREMYRAKQSGRNRVSGCLV